MEIKVSICIPTYNGARWLTACVESALLCSVPCEILIVDDCSTDETVSIANNFAKRDKRVKVHVNEKNLGLVGNWNRCLDFASGIWIKYLFQDDTLGENAIEEMLKIANEKTELIAAKRKFVFDSTTTTEAKKYYTDSVVTLEKLFPNETDISAIKISTVTVRMPAINFIGEPSTVMFKLTRAKQIGKFEVSFRQIGDLEFCLRIGTSFGIMFAEKAIINFLVHSQSVSAQNAQGRKYVSTFLDPVRLIDLQLHSEKYLDFRKNISHAEMKRLTFWLRLRCHEAKLNAKSNEELSELNKLFSEKPQLEKLAEKRGNKLLYRLLKLKRGG